jgi:hypothetical protein
MKDRSSYSSSDAADTLQEDTARRVIGAQYGKETMENSFFISSSPEAEKCFVKIERSYN